MKNVFLILLVACGGGDPAGLFAPKPECKGDAITPYGGTFQQVMSQLSIGSESDGLDLDRDGKPDNKLALASALAKDPIEDAMRNYTIMVPIEFFDMPGVASDSCVKLAAYVGAFDVDEDGDGVRPGVAGGDCNDRDAAIKPGASEVVGDGVDNDCDGLADEDEQDVPSKAETGDGDHDGMSVADGDCDDHNPMVKRGLIESCNDGLDNDCDGIADRSVGTTGKVTACNPLDPTTPQDIAIDPSSFDRGAPVIAFTSGTVSSANRLKAGPAFFSVAIPITDGVTLDLRMTGATLQADLQPDGTMTNGKLGGVIEAATADGLRGISLPPILQPDDSLLDVTFASGLGGLLGLPMASASVVAMYPNCRTPDIDVDGDGLEAFCDSNPSDSIHKVDVCIDGDGTEIRDAPGVECTDAMKNGKRRFVDGVSVEVNFATTLAKSLIPLAK